MKEKQPKFKRGTVVEIRMVGVVQNECNSGEGIRITVDADFPGDSIYVKRNRWWAVVPKTAAKILQL